MREFAIDTAALRGPVAVLMGGTSAEREVSLASGRAVHAALARRLGEVLAFDVGADVVQRLVDAGVAHAFIALHGRGGEDGAMQGALQTLGISYTGSGVLACALAMDKLRCKRFWQAEGVATPDFALVGDAAADYAALSARLGPRLFVKPASEGSSIGISPVDDAPTLRAAVALARRLRQLRAGRAPRRRPGIHGRDRRWRGPAVDTARNAAHVLRLRRQVPVSTPRATCAPRGSMPATSARSPGSPHTPTTAWAAAAGAAWT
jgi:D-alanine-D-alanine ligase-like ATP-grasp enzyme